MDLAVSEDIAEAIQARHLMTTIENALMFDEATPEGHVVATLARFSYDYAPVTSGGVIVGLVKGVLLVEHCEDQIGVKSRHLDGACVVSADAPVGHLLARLRGEPFLVVIGTDGVVGLVTPSDLNKQAGRAYFFLLIAGLEMAMAAAVRQHYPNQAETLGHLGPKRRVDVEERLSAERGADVFADLIAAMDFTDLLKITEGTPHLFSSIWGSSKTQWQSKVITPLIDLRNAVMHSVRPLLTDHDEALIELMALDDLVRGLLMRLGRELGTVSPTDSNPGPEVG